MLAACEAQAIYFALTGRAPAAAVTLPIVHSDVSGAGMSGTQSIWFELVKGVPAAVVALLVGIVAGLIAWRQYRVARAKLNLDLFEKRYELFMIVWAFASSVIQGGADTLTAKERIEMTNLLPKIEFLFGKDIADYVRKLSAQHASLWAILTATRANHGIMPAQHVDTHTELMEWFANEALEGVKQRFGVYLNFEEWH
ncbi:hypothetical protein GQ56_0116925 [Burkholderia paludis]|uniref:hypothetical protein n=1 Tax=Burkholderia paludis TaxID=1506587 RepID=UPI0004DB869B|nr:hypothetical protein [Burkholderia paludis]KFG96059.1 hypothetical protein GQ56_0116925 [Burkholderia paludis]